ncbi:site-specific integrase [uncultured Enterococcus sp.]|uniref:tyrosine-type recombinase/integrase n=1 Tax=uncultured Enterococcus sp. TaxID=167972 RepID=UPI002AA76FBE|nr:site-specific integrase [uncultured Enterococcus sp.]
MVKKGENIYKRKDGRWEGRYIKQRTTRNEIIYGYIYGRHYSEVKEKLTLVKAKYLLSDYSISIYSGTIESFVGNWMSATVRYTVKPTTYSNYVRLIKRHIIPAIGSLKLQKLKEADIQAFVYQLAEQELSSGTIRNIFNILKKALSAAVAQNYLGKNPCKNVVLPKKTTKKIRALSLAEQRKLEMLAMQERECSPVILALYSGMRIGEISGLKWEDIDFEKNLIHVQRTITRITNEQTIIGKTKVVAGTPKSDRSERLIPMALNLKNYLIEKRQWADGEYVIACNGGLAEPRTINYRFKKLTDKLGLEDVRFHSLRHTFATRCIERGVDIASLSQILGHQSTKLTLDTYADSLIENRQAAMAKIDELFMNAQ